MKILHMCLASFYIDNYSYQENMLSKFHKKIGHEVEIVASLFTFDENGKGCYFSNGIKYINEYEIPVTRLEYKKNIFSKIFRQYYGVYDTISEANPDIIFIHGCQFNDLKYVVKYIKLHPNVEVFVDNHADFSNSARNILSKNILHKILWRYHARKIEPYTTKFYGVLPARVDFLENIYKLPHEKIELLVMGADDDKINEVKNGSSREYIRKKYGIKDSDFLIVTGGKIDYAKKQTILLMKAIQEIKNKNVKLIVFGSVTNDLKNEVNSLADGVKVQYIGWIEAAESYKYFNSSDLVIFPGRHSVFWEQVVGMGIPMIVKYWDGTTHVDLGGNCKFLYHDSVSEIKDNVELLLTDKLSYYRMKEVAEDEGRDIFSYTNIAKRSIKL